MKVAFATPEALTDALAADWSVAELPAGTVDIASLELRAAGRYVKIVGSDRGTVIRGPMDVSAPGLDRNKLVAPMASGFRIAADPGRWCFLFRQGVVCQRVRIIGYGSGVARTDGPVDERVEYARVLDHAWGVAAAEGDRIRLFANQGLPEVGECLLLTDGPRHGKEHGPCEFVEVVALSENATVRVKEPLAWKYEAPLLCRVGAIRNLTIEGITFEDVQGYGGHAKGCPGLRLRDCSFANTFYIATASDVVGTSLGGPVLLNGVARGRFSDCTKLTKFAGEEACRDVLLERFRVDKATENAIQWDHTCGPLTVRDGVVAGAAIHPLAIGADDITLKRVTVDAGYGRESQLSGQRMEIDRLGHHDRQLVMHNGSFTVSRSSWAHAQLGLGGTHPSPSVGTISNCTGPYNVGPGSNWTFED